MRAENARGKEAYDHDGCEARCLRMADVRAFSCAIGGIGLRFGSQMAPRHAVPALAPFPKPSPAGAISMWPKPRSTVLITLACHRADAAARTFLKKGREKGKRKRKSNSNEGDGTVRRACWLFWRVREWAMVGGYSTMYLSALIHGGSPIRVSESDWQTLHRGSSGGASLRCPAAVSWLCSFLPPRHTNGAGRCDVDVRS